MPNPIKHDDLSMRRQRNRVKVDRVDDLAVGATGAVGNVEYIQVDPIERRDRHIPNKAVITSADESSSFRDDDSDTSDEELTTAKPDDGSIGQKNDELFFDDQADDENEAYVYKHLRFGLEETVHVKHHSTERGLHSKCNNTTMKVLKPRYSDAVLSCPCCLNIVCMDCQRHERYKNQFRAMFVVGIMVRWDLQLIYDESLKMLVPVPSGSTNDQIMLTAEIDGAKPIRRETNTERSLVPDQSVADESSSCCRSQRHENDTVQKYFTVCCANCETVVASLDMSDEVYYFHGCVESA